MRLLHTSDWHLGHLFCGRRRDGEFRDFLAWLLELIARESVDVLLIAGDLFDTNTPGNACAGMYYDFLTRVRRESGCRRVVITGGNHDSPSFLNAPRGLLDAAFDIKVFGEAAEDPADEVVPVPDDAGVPALIIGAVPYLRDADLHISNWEESPAEGDAARRRGFRAHYARVAEAAERLRAGRPIPFVLTGHFAAAGAPVFEGDGVREFVGGLRQADESDLPPSADYIALGHIHQSQRIGGKEHIRYCGSPLRMSFADTKPRELLLVDFDGRQAEVTPVPVPQTREILTLRGNWEQIVPELEALRERPDEVFCRVLAADLPPHALAAALGNMFADRRHNYPLVARSLVAPHETEREVRSVEELRTMTETEVFRLLLDRRGITGETERRQLIDAFRTLLAEMREREKQP